MSRAANIRQAGDEMADRSTHESVWRRYAAGSFRYLETYNIVAFIYLLMTVTLSLGLRALERRMRQKQ